MSNKSFKLVTIICEPVLRSQIISLTKKLGASGFTVTDLCGEGSRRKRTGEVPEQKIKVEIVAESHLAETIAHEISGTYFENYSLIIYLAEISILRGRKT